MSIAQQFPELAAGGVFAGIGIGFREEDAFGKIKIFAKVAGGFFFDRFGAPVAALLGDSRVVTGAIEADAEVGVALVARLASTGLSGERPLPAAGMTMFGHSHRDRLAPGRRRRQITLIINCNLKSF